MAKRSVYACFVLLCWLMVCVASCKPIAHNLIPSPGNTTSDLPLSKGDTWVYQHTRYAGFNTSQIMTFTRTITETVVGVSTQDSFITVKIQREASAEYLVSDDVHAAAPDLVPSSLNYWLVIDAERIYHTAFTPDLPRIQETGELELVFPLAVGEKWYLNQTMADQHPDMAVDSMLRKVVIEKQMDLTFGRSATCYELQEIIGGHTFEKWFCPGVGWIERRSDHHGTPYGWREVLVEFSPH